MIVGSIDLQQGQAVQLRQGREHVLTSPRDPAELAEELNRYGPVAVIDLDAAMGKGDNLALIRRICRVAETRVGGGIRDLDRAKALLRAGARQLIIGTAATPELLGRLPRDRVMVALDHDGGVVVDEAWTRSTGETVTERASRLAPFCSGYLCTFVRHEGMMQGIPMGEVERVAAALPHPVTVAGGVADTGEAAALCRLGVDVQVGMALYTGELDPAEVVIGSVRFDDRGLIPTVVQARDGQVLMVAHSSEASLRRALREGRGVYYSRSRQELWEKGATSGHTQRLVSCRADCDRDTLLFVVEQTGPACHRGSRSCFEPARPSLHRLVETLRERRAGAPAGSYTAKLFADRELLLRKINEEAFEVTRAADPDELRWEIADALFFMMTLAVDEGLDWQDIEAELCGRHLPRGTDG